MDRKDQTELVEQLTSGIAKSVCIEIRNGTIPETWDGHELRELLAILFNGERSSLMQKGGKRRRDFLNTYRMLPRI